MQAELALFCDGTVILEPGILIAPIERVNHDRDPDRKEYASPSPEDYIPEDLLQGDCGVVFDSLTNIAKDINLFR